MGLADQVTLDEQLPVDFRRLFQVDIKHLAGHPGFEDGLADLSFKRGPLMPRASGQEAEPRDVAGKPDARGDHDLTHRATASEPFAGGLGEIGDLHIDSKFQIRNLRLSSPDARRSKIQNDGYPSACLIWSRIFAARS